MSPSKHKKTEEQLAEEKRIGEEAAKKHAERRKVLVHSGAGIGNNMQGFGPMYKGSGPEGTPTEYAVFKDKRGEYIKIGDADSGGKAYWDADQGWWRSAGPGRHGAARYWSSDVAAKPSGGGGGGGHAPAPARESGEVIYPQGEVIDTGPTGGYLNTQQPMFDYYPTTPNQALNPLVDPNNWVYTPNQQYGLLNSAGVYVNNPKPITGVLT